MSLAGDVKMALALAVQALLPLVPVAALEDGEEELVLDFGGKGGGGGMHGGGVGV
jgi:hypothetical protein